MKRNILIFFTALFSISMIAQVPQGFNYQAVARDNSGNPIASANLDVRVAILNETTRIWQEDHSVNTTSLGFFSLVIGDESALRTGGSVDLFSDIDWSTGSFSIEISIDNGSGFVTMGAAPMMSVPFALYAQNSSGNLSWSNRSDTLYTNSSVGIGTSSPNQSLLAIQSSDPQVDKALFEVRNDAGIPVFAVFNDGVMVYVDENKKGVKGGFAVGGYNAASKGVTQEYLRITPDSVRIWVPDNQPVKGTKGGFAVGGYNAAAKATTNNFLEVSSSNTNIYFDTTTQAKGFKGGFAVGGFNKTNKGDSDQLMSLTSYNYLIGQDAGASITSGRNNTFFGWKAGTSTTTGNSNIMIGDKTGYSNTEGRNNVFIGNDAGYSNNKGVNNVMIGFEAGYYNYGEGGVFDGDYNVFIGHLAGHYNISGGGNVFLGDWAGWSSDSGDYQTAIGHAAGAYATGAWNSFFGAEAGFNAVTGKYNTYMGIYSGRSGVGSYNTYLGYSAGYTGEGESNVLIGASAGYGVSDKEFFYNTYVGNSSGRNTTTGSSNVFVGINSGGATTSGSSNVYLGAGAGYLNSTGSSNVFIGNNAGFYEEGAGKLYIANTETSSPLIYGDFSTSQLKLNGNAGVNYLGEYGYGLVVDIPAGQARYFSLYSIGDAYVDGTLFQASDKGYKENIIPVDNAISKLKQVKGVYFDYTGTKADLNGGVTSIGVIAQDVESVFPELVRENMDGMKAVNYSGLIPVLIEAIKDQQSQIDAQQQEIEFLKQKLSGL